MRFLSLLFLVAFVGALGYFAYLNADNPVTIDLFGQTKATNVPVLSGGVYLLGMLTGWAVVGMLRRSWTRATESDRR